MQRWLGAFLTIPLLPPVNSKMIKASSIDLALDASDLVLQTLRDAARLAPTSYLQDAAGLALGIITTLQVRSNFLWCGRCLAPKYQFACYFRELGAKSIPTTSR